MWTRREAAKTSHQILIQSWHSRREEFGVQYLPQGHLDMWNGGAGDPTTDLPRNGQVHSTELRLDDNDASLRLALFIRLL